MENIFRSEGGWANSYLASSYPASGLFSGLINSRPISLCRNGAYTSLTERSGYISLLVLLLLTLFSALGTEVYLKANAEHRMVKRETQSRQALYIAEGGIEWAKGHLLVNPELRQGRVSFDTGQVHILIEFNEGEYKVTAKGVAGLAVRKIEERLELVNGTWVIKGYQELHR